MKLARMLCGWSGSFFEGVADIVEVDDAAYQRLCDSHQAEPVCTLNPHVAAASMAEAAVMYEVELTTSNQELADYLKKYGAVVHLHKKKK